MRDAGVEGGAGVGECEGVGGGTGAEWVLVLVGVLVLKRAKVLAEALVFEWENCW